MKKIKWIIIVVIMIAVLFSACSKDADLIYEGELKFTGLDKEINIAYDDIYAMESIKATVKSITSDGEERVNEVEGVLLETLLSLHGLSQKDFVSIRLIAGDGYAMDVPVEIIKEKDIILAYKFDDENLEEKKMPLRVAINDVRSMYYVANLAEIQFSNGKAEDASVKKVILLETAYLNLDTQSYTYYDSEDSAILPVDLLDTYLEGEVEKVYMLANDGYDKIESFDVLKEGYIKITGKDAPLFTGKDLPVGMNVKCLMILQTGNISFASVESAKGVIKNRIVGEKEGVAFDKLMDMIGLVGDYYIMTANDGYSVEVSRDSLSQAVIYVMEDGACAVKFNETYPKNTDIKYLLSIELGDGANSITGENTGIADAQTETESDSVKWTITFDGLSDGLFDMTSDRAQRKLELVELHTERMKNDEILPEDWKGYRLLDVLEFLHVDDFDSIVITAVDGYEVELVKNQLDEETILAVEKNGKALIDDDNLVQLIQNTEFATTWVKGVAKITVN